MAIDAVNLNVNTNLFAQYRLLCRKMADRDLTPALMMQHMGLKMANAFDNTPYALFCSQFYPLTAFGHKNMAGGDHEITTTGGGVATAVIVRIRLAFVEIKGDTTVNVIN
jgi:hypothetical protein